MNKLFENSNDRTSICRLNHENTLLQLLCCVMLPAGAVSSLIVNIFCVSFSAILHDFAPQTFFSVNMKLTYTRRLLSAQAFFCRKLILIHIFSKRARGTSGKKTFKVDFVGFDFLNTNERAKESPTTFVSIHFQ